MLKFIATPAVLSAGLCSAAPAQETETLRVGMSRGYFPFTFVRQDQRLSNLRSGNSAVA